MSHEPRSPAKSVLSEDADAGRAFRWSVATLLLILAAIAVLYLIHREQTPHAKNNARLSSPGTTTTAAAEVPEVHFIDITAGSGVAFLHHTGAYGEKLLPETMGSGCAFFDFDNDGDQDLLLVNSTDWPGRGSGSDKPPTSALYRNDGSGRFADATAGSGLDISFYGMGVAVGDYDNNGRVDLYLTGVGGNRLFHNDGDGKFRDVTESAGVGGSAEDWGASAAWLDFDNDGDLDLFVCNYVRWSREIDLGVNYQLAGIGRAYGPPMNFPGAFPRLYRNNGAGKFTDVSAASGVQIRNGATGQPLAKSLGVAPVDVNNDGWIDLIIANDTTQNFVFTNRHDGTFREVGAASGIAFDSFGGARGAMGIDASRFQDDDALGISIGNFANEMTAFYVSQRDALTFTDEAIGRGIGQASQMSLTFGVFFFDYDLDGWLDLLTTNGHIEEEIARAQRNQTYRQAAQLFWNARGGAGRDRGFTLAPPAKCGTDLVRPIVGRGSAYGDIDNDGDLDVIMTQVGGPPLLLKNSQNLGHRWLRLKLVGTRSNRDAIGAWVKVRAGGQVLWRHVMPTRGYLSQSELPVTIGLGTNRQVEEVVIQWPDGSRQKLEPTPALGKLTIVEQPK